MSDTGKLLTRLAGLGLSPAPLTVYKPRAKDGMAMQLQLRLEPSWNEKGYIDAVDGGLFLDFAVQIAKGDDGYARFGWDNRLSAKLGVPDISALLLGYRFKRLLGRPVPAEIGGKEPDGNTVSLFHKFGEATTAIAWRFEESRSFLGASRSKELRRSISLSLAEELQVECYLQGALRAFQLVGK